MSVSVSVGSKVNLFQYLALFPSKRLEESRDVCLCFRLSKDEFLQHMSWELSGQHFSISEFCSSFLSQNIWQSFFQNRVQFDWCLCLSKTQVELTQCSEIFLAKNIQCRHSGALFSLSNDPAVFLKIQTGFCYVGFCLCRPKASSSFCPKLFIWKYRVLASKILTKAECLCSLCSLCFLPNHLELLLFKITFEKIHAWFCLFLLRTQLLSLPKIIEYQTINSLTP